MIKVSTVQIKESRLRLVREGHTVLTSLEGENPGGSIKDHMVEGELKNLLASGHLKSGDTIAEISSGSTAMSLAYYARLSGLTCVLFVPFGLPNQKRIALEDLGAELHFVDPVKGYADYAQFLNDTKVRSFNQFGDRTLARHYSNLSKQVNGGQVDLVVGSVGTGHSLVGVTDGFKTGLVPISAEPITAGQIPGIRNVKLEHFGKDDPCDTDRLQRIEVASPVTWKTLLTDQGEIEVHASFSVVLGALEKLEAAESLQPQTLFLIGADNKKLAA